MDDSRLVGLRDRLDHGDRGLQIAGDLHPPGRDQLFERSSFEPTITIVFGPFSAVFCTVPVVAVASGWTPAERLREAGVRMEVPPEQRGAELESAMASPLGLGPRRTAGRGVGAATKAPDFVAYVGREAAGIDALGSTADARRQQAFTGGYTIETTVDLKATDAAVASVKAILGAEGDPTTAIASVEPGNGAIRVLFGGLDPNLEFDPASQGRRQPGSSFKPYVYLARLKAGIDPRSQFDSASPQTLRCNGAPWTVNNFEGEGRGMIDVEEAMTRSVNVVFAQLMTKVSPGAVRDVAEKAGISREALTPPECAMALGGLRQGVSPLEQAAGFATFAAKGVAAEPYAIVRIKDRRGNVVYERKPKTTQAFRDKEAGVVNAALKRVVEGGGVRVTKTVEEQTQTIEEPLEHQDVIVRRVPINRPVEALLPVRQEGEVTIIPVIEEVLVVDVVVVVDLRAWRRVGERDLRPVGGERRVLDVAAGIGHQELAHAVRHVTQGTDARDPARGDAAERCLEAGTKLGVQAVAALLEVAAVGHLREDVRAAEEPPDQPWASVGNRTSFWFTMASATVGLAAGILLAEPIADLLGLDDANLVRAGFVGIWAQMNYEQLTSVFRVEERSTAYQRLRRELLRAEGNSVDNGAMYFVQYRNQPEDASEAISQTPCCLSYATTGSLARSQGPPEAEVSAGRTPEPPTLEPRT